MDIPISARHKFSQETALGPQTQLVKTIPCRSTAFSSYVPTKCRFDDLTAQPPQSLNFVAGQMRVAPCVDHGVLRARLGFGACPARSFESISLREVT